MSSSEVQMFGLTFCRCTLEQTAKMIVQSAIDEEKGLVVTPNVDHLVQMDKDDEMAHIFKQARYCVADGMPIIWFSRIIGDPLPERVTGADLLPEVAAQAAINGVPIFLLGGMPGVALQAGEKLQTQFPGLEVAGTYCPPFGFEHDEGECQKIVSMINDSDAKILFVGVGAPKQEKWAVSHMDQLNVGPILGVGAAFDFASGMISRSPEFMQKAGVEWLWRLMKEPGRLWKRYLLQDSRFVVIAFREWWKIRSQ